MTSMLLYFAAGPSWGMNGYMLLARNKSNMCGVATNASYLRERDHTHIIYNVANSVACHVLYRPLCNYYYYAENGQ